MSTSNNQKGFAWKVPPTDTEDDGPWEEITRRLTTQPSNNTKLSNNSKSADNYDQKFPVLPSACKQSASTTTLTTTTTTASTTKNKKGSSGSRCKQLALASTTPTTTTTTASATTTACTTKKKRSSDDITKNEKRSKLSYGRVSSTTDRKPPPQYTDEDPDEDDDDDDNSMPGLCERDLCDSDNDDDDDDEDYDDDEDDDEEDDDDDDDDNSMPGLCERDLYDSDSDDDDDTQERDNETDDEHKPSYLSTATASASAIPSILEGHPEEEGPTEEDESSSWSDHRDLLRKAENKENPDMLNERFCKDGIHDVEATYEYFMNHRENWDRKTITSWNSYFSMLKYNPNKKFMTCYDYIKEANPTWTDDTINKLSFKQTKRIMDGLEYSTSIGGWNIHHLQLKSMGGSDNPRNLRPLRYPNHRGTHFILPMIFRNHELSAPLVWLNVPDIARLLDADDDLLDDMNKAYIEARRLASIILARTSYGGPDMTDNQRNSQFGGINETDNQRRSRSEQGFGGINETDNQQRARSEQGFGGVNETDNQRNSSFGGINETDNQQRARSEQGFGGINETDNQRNSRFGGVNETDNQRNSRTVTQFGGVNETDNQRRAHSEHGFGSVNETDNQRHSRLLVGMATRWTPDDNNWIENFNRAEQYANIHGNVPKSCTKRLKLKKEFLSEEEISKK